MSNRPQGYLSEAEVSERLQWLESKYDLLRYQVDGWCAWPLLRFSVSRAIQNLPLDKRVVRSFSRGELFRVALRDAVAWINLRPARYVAFSHCSAHSEVEREHKKDFYLDDLLRSLPGGWKIEMLDSRSAYVNPLPQLVPRKMTTVALGLAQERLARFGRHDTEPVARAMADALGEGLGLDAWSPDVISRILASFHWKKKLFGRLLRRIQPEFLLLVAADYSIIAAARELGVRVIELQHGFTHRHFPGTSWTRYALPYKAAMALPDRVFLYGSHWQEEVEALGFWNEELRAVGSPRIDLYRARPVARPRGACTIVVTTQGTDTEHLIAFFVEFVRLADGRKPYRLRIKMHPAYHATDHLFDAAFGGNPHVQLIAGNATPSTFQLLKEADYHVSIYSTCHYEALALGVPTVIVPLTGAENVWHLHEEGHAAVARTPLDLFEKVSAQERERVPALVGDRYFTPGALDNMRREIEELTGGAGPRGVFELAALN